MGKRRPKLDPNAPWEQLALRLTSDEQFAYERITLCQHMVDAGVSLS
jgi:hypothetical protein